jgi:DNA-binding beta-propeller fold protein YncE
LVIAPYRVPGKGPGEREVLLIDGRTGKIKQSWPVPENPLAVLVNPLTGHLLVASAGPVDTAGQPKGDGTLSVLDMGSGSILQQVTVGLLPGELFDDRTAQRLLVINRTTTLTGGALVRSYGDNVWSQELRSLKHQVGWLPFTAPAVPVPPTDITVSVLDLTRL